VAWNGLSVSLCVLVMTVSPATMAEPVEMPFGGKELCIVLVFVMYGHHLANTFE